MATAIVVPIGDGITMPTIVGTTAIGAKTNKDPLVRVFKAIPTVRAGMALFFYTGCAEECFVFQVLCKQRIGRLDEARSFVFRPVV